MGGKERLQKFLKILGPGIITGRDDDPSFIAAYSQQVRVSVSPL
jgi:hypothetical protein